jgi:hypothetical protein
MEQRTDTAFRLTWELSHMESYDGEYEMELNEFPGSEWIAGLIETTPLELPDPIIFEADFQALTRTDYPTNNRYFPVMSRRMYYTIQAIGAFPHRVIPVAMVDDTSFVFESEQRYSSDGTPKPEVTNFNDFVAVQILESSNYFDFEHSVYERHPRDPEWVDTVERYVLNEPEGGFPPLFRLEVTPTELFISSKAREALREAGIRGVAYYTLDDGYSLEEEVDIPVELPTYP